MMNSIYVQLVRILAVVIGCNFFIFGQDKINCDSYLYKTEDQIYRAKSRGGGIIDKYLVRYIQQCSESQYFQQAKELLVIALEENAEHHLFIAKYYLKKFEEKKSGIMGAWSRLREITERYPTFSKMDEVLFLSVKANLYLSAINDNTLEENRLDEAKKLYKRLLQEFPFSNYVCEANKLFQQPKE
jgi:outer membrane protein assembly factor BamD (BamD/ComL family)